MPYSKINTYIKFLDSRTSPSLIICEEAAKRFRKWAEENKITHYYIGNPTHKKLLQRNYKLKWNDEITPYEDHAKIFKNNIGELLFITQPYLDYKIKEGFSDDAKNEMREWAKLKGLDISISEELSWHYPGRTTLIVYKFMYEKNT